MSEPKRLKLTVTEKTENLKNKVLNDILRVGTYIIIDFAKTMKVPVPLLNLSITNQIGTATYSIINTIRKIRNTGALSLESVTHTLKIQHRISVKNPTTNVVTMETKEYSKNLKEVIEFVERNVITIPTGTDEKREYFGTMMPLLELLNLFPLRFTESRLGQSVFFDKSNQAKGKSVSVYGLSSEHSPHLEGITYSPERKSSLLQSCGALTIAIALTRQTNSQYKGKYKDALYKSISHLPSAEEIVEYFAMNETRSSTEIMRELGNVLLLTGDRQTHRVAIPFGVFLSKNFQHFSNDSEMETDRTGTMYTFKQGPDVPIRFDTAGKKAFEHLAYFQGRNWTMYWSGTPNELRQIVFHSMMGTMCTSFEALSTITSNTEWTRRQQIGDHYRKRGSGPEVTIEPIKMIYASKMISVAKNRLLAGGTGTISNNMPIAGESWRTYTRPEIEFTCAEVRQQVAPGTNPQAIMTSLKSTKNYVIRKIEECQGRVAYGTTKWFTLEDFITEQNNPLDLVVENRGPNFLTTDSR